MVYHHVANIMPFLSNWLKSNRGRHNNIIAINEICAAFLPYKKRDNENFL